MGLTQIPERTDASLGREKTNSRAVQDLNFEVPAEEYNRLLDYVIELGKAVGLRDGTTPDSIEQRLRTQSPIAYSFTMVGSLSSGYTAEPGFYVREGEDPLVVGDAHMDFQGSGPAEMLYLQLGGSVPSEYQIQIMAEDPTIGSPCAVMGLWELTEYTVGIWLQLGAQPLRFHITILYPAST